MIKLGGIICVSFAGEQKKIPFCFHLNAPPVKFPAVRLINDLYLSIEYVLLFLFSLLYFISLNGLSNSKLKNTHFYLLSARTELHVAGKEQNKLHLL